MRYIYPALLGTVTRDAWLSRLLTYPYGVNPPAWWVRSQVELGRAESAAYAIWHRNYKPERKYVIWDQAPDEDWRECGYLL